MKRAIIAAIVGGFLAGCSTLVAGGEALSWFRNLPATADDITADIVNGSVETGDAWCEVPLSVRLKLREAYNQRSAEKLLEGTGAGSVILGMWCPGDPLPSPDLFPSIMRAREQ